ncbi:MAG: class I SAM-dependent methyltransferase [Thermoplasmata archaeon]
MTDLREHSGTARTVCRVCGAPEGVRPFLSLGSLPMGNAFIAPAEIPDEQQFPLDIGFCERCCLVQIVEPAPVSAIEKVYRNYSYVPTGATLERHYRALAADIVSTVTPRPDALFVDIGSNDGLLLRSIRAHAPGCGIVGVEPSPKISEIARGHGVPTINRFFDEAAADELLSLHGPADVISATQVLQHIRDPVRLLRSVVRMLRPNGVLVLEGRAYFPDVAEKVAFDTFYHELLFCFTLHSLQNLLAQAGFVVFRAERSDAYGGSLRVFAQKREGTREPLASVAKTLSEEVRAGLDRFDAYARFGAQVEGLRTALRRTVNAVRSSGQTISAYGAPSTGTTLLSYCGFGLDQIEYIVDDNPLKQGLVTPGSHIPITDSSALEQRPTDCVLILAWRLKDEILARLAPLRGSRIKGVIIPLPTPELVR